MSVQLWDGVGAQRRGRAVRQPVPQPGALLSLSWCLPHLQSMAVPVRAGWEISHMMATEPTHFSAGGDVNTSPLVFVPGQGKENKEYSEQDSNPCFFRRLLVQTSLAQHSIYRSGL